MQAKSEQAIEEIRLTSEHIGLAACRWGRVGGSRVLALHGWLDNAASFSRLAPLLSNPDLVALDLAGHGHSEWRPAGMHYHFVDFVPDILAAANILEWETFTLLGHSMGAGIATLIAAAFPERLEKLVLIEGIGPWSSNPQEGNLHLAQATRQILRGQRAQSRLHPDVESAAKARQSAGDLSYQSALILTERGSRKDLTGVSWRSDPRLRFRSPHYLSEEQVQAFLPKITAPTLLIQAEEDWQPDNHNWQERIALIPDILSLKISGGHHLHLDNPEPVARAINRFLGQ